MSGLCTIYELVEPEIMSWWSSEVIQGFAWRMEPGGPLFLERAGPFVPPVFFPYVFQDREGFPNAVVGVEGSKMVVREDVKQKLEAQGFPGVSFHKTVKRKVVYLRYETWGWENDRPPVMPEEGEPENYILEFPHSPEAAAAMPDTWEVKFPKFPFRYRRGRTYYRQKKGKKWRSVDVEIRRIYTDLTEFPPVFDPKERPDLCAYCVTEAVWDWFRRQLGAWIRRERVEIVRSERLKGLYLRHEKFRPSATGKSYDFCLTCCTPFNAMQLLDTLREGYCTLDGQTWICDKCFEKYAAQYDWKET